MSIKTGFKKATKCLYPLILGAALMSGIGCEREDDEEKEKPLLRIGSAFNTAADVRGSVPTLEVLKNTGTSIMVVHVDGNKLLPGNRYIFEENGESLYVDGSIDGAEVTVNGGQLAVSHAIYADSKVRVNVPAAPGWVTYPTIINGIETTATQWLESVPYYPYNAYAEKFDPALVVSAYLSTAADVSVTDGAAIKKGILFIRSVANELDKSVNEEEINTIKDEDAPSVDLSYNAKSRVIIFAKKDADLSKAVKESISLLKREDEKVVTAKSSTKKSSFKIA